MKSFEERKNNIEQFVLSEFYVPMKEKELAIMLQVSSEDRPEFKRALEELLSENRLQITKRGRYIKPEQKVLTGTFISNAKGFGFVEVEGSTEDYYIPENRVNGAFHQDTVSIRLLPGQRGKRQEAEVVSIVCRSIETVVGTYQKSKNFGFVIPDNTKMAQDIFIAKEHTNGAVDGHKVVVRLTSYGGPDKNPEGIITEILGHINDPGVDILSIVKGFDLPMEFTEKQLKQAERASRDVSEADREGRLDLRDVMMVTIDGEDAKDLDDAVSLTMDENGYHLGVHIADVSNYVQENSALDKEALKRGTSVYLVDRVIPMLPHTLSNGICSLNEKEDRLAQSCLMDINEKGEVVDYRIAETVINVNRRMSYSVVAKILETHDEACCAEYKELVGMFEQMAELAGILRERRKKRGSIDFDFQESKIILDANGKPTDIKPYERNVATRLIEDFMLIANETVAAHFYWLEAPFVYRTHEAPDPEKIKKLALFISNFGYRLKTSAEEVHPKELQKLLASIEGTDEEGLISRLTLRSMKQARYSPDCTGHFGLACQYYCHFTSPIRRYPDLQIHRIIKDYLRGRLTEDKMEHYRSILDNVCKKSSELERRADEAERETEKCKKAQYMADRIGEHFTGVISGVTAWGIYVELPNTVEGLIHISKIPGDYYIFDENQYEIYGEKTNRTFKLGQTVQVTVHDVDYVSNTIDFMLDETEEA
ncbi:MAG: ribonuclease R [Lachnospiraceae bacterium]|nr:ribonuclease R [Lachnospiraceae bacterium]MDD5852585.1 ribonuclease R [Lachnospiraceae bacterium]